MKINRIFIIIIIAYIGGFLTVIPIANGLAWLRAKYIDNEVLKAYTITASDMIDLQDAYIDMKALSDYQESFIDSLQAIIVYYKSVSETKHGGAVVPSKEDR